MRPELSLNALSEELQAHVVHLRLHQRVQLIRSLAVIISCAEPIDCALGFDRSCVHLIKRVVDAFQLDGLGLLLEDESP